MYLKHITQCLAYKCPINVSFIIYYYYYCYHITTTATITISYCMSGPELPRGQDTIPFLRAQKETQRTK